MAIVVAANFGIRETSIGFALKGQKCVNALYFCEEEDIVQMKVSSCALLNQDNKLDCLGFKALTKFNELQCEGKSVGWKYFPTFPALKETKSVNGEFYISDESGEHFPAKTLFAEVVGYLKDMLLSHFRHHGVLAIDMTWVFIVPASWDSRAKTCLTNTGAQVGLSAERILLITDAEAASFTCLENLYNIGTNKKCLLINWNEGKTEFAEVESSFDQTIRVTFLEGNHSADMNTVQEKIFSFIGLLLDDDTKISFDDFADEVDFTRDLKLHLRRLSLGGTGYMTVKLPESVGQRFGRLRNKAFGTIAKVIGGKLRISHEMIVPLVIEALEKTISYVDEIVSRAENRDLTDVIFFGDFAEYQIAADALRKNLNQKIQIHIAEDVATAILRGGVLFGLSPEIVTSRILRIAGDEEKGSDIWAEPKVTAHHQVFAAFDFGTTYSGYAYSIKNTPTEIWTNKAWNSGEKLLSLKTPTSVLLQPDKSFHSFGFDAENKYSNLAEDDEHGDWMLFRQFKMLLHQTKDGLRRETTVEDISGKRMPALTIFSMAIRYLKEQLMETLRLRIADISESDILFVITVPAIWSDGAKQFMKEAAIEAGIDSQQVGLCLEPEAAAIWCQNIQTDVKGELSKSGTQFIVVDVGGGTADISVQEKKADGRLKEIHRPDGGAWGGTNVDKEFFSWLGLIIGQERIHHLRETEFGEQLDLLKEFEIKKRSIGNNSVVIRLPYSLRESSEQIKKQIDALGLSEKVSLSKDKIKVDPEIAKRWFNATISNIASHVSNLLQEQHLKEVRLVMVVGGFAECKLLQSAMIETLSNVQVIIPEEAGVAVLKGAVEFAQRPHVIASRVMKCSYGINKPVEYDPNAHDSSKVVIENGKKVVHLFEQFVKTNDEVNIGEVIAKGFKPTSLNETKVDIYSSAHPNPRYVSDRECTKLAQINVKHESGKTANDKIFDVLFEFGKTEVFVRVILRISGEEFEVKLECL